GGARDDYAGPEVHPGSQRREHEDQAVTPSACSAAWRLQGGPAQGRCRARGRLARRGEHVAERAPTLGGARGGFKEFPPGQKPASFSLDQVMQKLTETAGSAQ